MKKFNCALLVDDDSTTNHLNIKTIEKMMVAEEVKVAVNGEQALNVLQNFIETTKQAPELILLDMYMPFMNGFEFLEYFYLKNIKNKDKVKIIILSNGINAQDKHLYHKYLAKNVSFMDKPLTEDKLWEVLNVKPLLA
ncbi:MAG: response regulator [Cytophagaceae bacterium]